MAHRYKLKDCPENRGLNTRTIEQTKLFKDKWVYSKQPIDFGNFLNLIDHEEAPNFKDFKKKEEHAGDKTPQQNPGTNRVHRTISSKKLSELSTEKLYAIAKKRGFPEQELREDHEFLQKLLKLDYRLQKEEAL